MLNRGFTRRFGSGGGGALIQPATPPVETNVIATTAALTLAPVAATVKADTSVIATTGALTLAPVNASVSTGTTVLAIDENFDGQTVGQFPTPFSGGPVLVDNTHSVSGSNSAEATMYENNTSSGGSIILPGGNVYEGGEVWIQFKMYCPSGFSWGAYSPAGGRVKFIEFTCNESDHSGNNLFVELNSTTSNGFTFALTANDEQPSPNTYWNDFGADSDHPQADTWVKYEAYAKLHHDSVSVGGDARMRFWRDNTLIGDEDALPTLGDAGGYCRAMKINSYWNGGSPQDQSYWLDDIKIAVVEPAGRDAAGNPFIG